MIILAFLLIPFLVTPIFCLLLTNQKSLLSCLQWGGCVNALIQEKVNYLINSNITFLYLSTLNFTCHHVVSLSRRLDPSKTSASSSCHSSMKFYSKNYAPLLLFPYYKYIKHQSFCEASWFSL